MSQTNIDTINKVRDLFISFVTAKALSTENKRTEHDLKAHKINFMYDSYTQFFANCIGDRLLFVSFTFDEVLDGDLVRTFVENFPSKQYTISNEEIFISTFIFEFETRKDLIKYVKSLIR